MDVALRGGTMLTMDDGRLGIVGDGAVGVVDGRITYVGAASDLDDTAVDRIVDTSGCVVTPGLVNAHTHMPLTLCRGGAQDVPEIEWMRRALAPVRNAMTDADRIAGSRLGALETIASGVTTICEYTSDVANLVETVYEPLGVRIAAVETINEVGTGHSGDPDDPYPFDAAKGDAAEERAEALFEKYGEHALVEPAYGPQALDMVRPERLERLHERATDDDRKLHVHVAQGEREARQIAARYDGHSTVEVLEELGLADDRLVAVHLHGASVDERRRLAESDVSMVGNPSSIAAIDGITPPVVDYGAAGGTVALGTDQAPGPGGHDFNAELRIASLLSKTDRTDPMAFPAWTALRAGTVGGADALGIGVGRLAEGAPADIAVFEPGLGAAPFVEEPFHTAIPNVVFGSPRTRDVLVEGRFLVRDGTFVDADPEAAVADAEARAAALFERAEADWRAAGSELVDAVDDGWL